MKFLNRMTAVLACLFCAVGTFLNAQENPQAVPDKIQVLNFATFHMGFTPDANTVEFDEKDKENQKRVHEIAEKLAAFKPTVIVVETLPENDAELQKEYLQYLDTPDMFFAEPNEVHLLAYEIGRLAGAQRIYGIDAEQYYNYNIGNEMTNEIDSVWHDKFAASPFAFFPEVKFNVEGMTLFEKLENANSDATLDFFLTANADILTHVGSKDGYEGADEAAKFYQRNLRMYSNLNRLELTENDRVFILMGGAHTAYFRDFFSRSPKYNAANVFDYLK